jgi:hypothetical protein
MYDPFENLAKIPESQQEEPKPFTVYDPFSSLERVSAKEGEAKLPFAPYKESLAATALDTIPFAKYLLPEEQSNFNELSSDEKSSAIGWQVLGAALFVAGGPLLARAGRGMSSIIRVGTERALPRLTEGALAKRMAGAVAKEAPIEDVLVGISSKTRNYEFKPFNYEEALTSKLRGESFGSGEIESITKYKLTGERAELKNAVLERSFEKKPMTTKWSESVTPTSEPYGGFRLKPELDASLSEEVLRSRHYSKEYGKIFSREVLHTREKDISKDFFERVYQKQMEAKYPTGEAEIPKSFDLREITEGDFAHFVTDMLENKREYRSALSTTAGRFWPAALTPTRVIYGLNESSWGAYSGVYQPLRGAFESSRKYTFDRTLTWLTQLQQRGLGEIKFSKYGEFSFKPAAEFTSQESDKAYQILRQMDNISGQAKNGVSQELIDSQISGLVSELNPSGTTRKVIDAWRDFSDTLYSEFMIHKIPSVLRKEGLLTPFGQNSVDALTAKLTPKILDTFATGSSRSTVQKVTELKETLNEVKRLLAPNEGSHPWFQLTGKDLDDHVSRLAKELTLTNEKGNLIGYTDHYTARVSADQERNFEKWSQALVGKRGGFEKQRKSEFMIGEPVDFKTMIESRIHSQANAMFMYPVVDDVVKTAKAFPTHLASYVEHHLARVLNQPSSIDHTLARVFENTIGRVEGLFGKEGTWNARRIMDTAQTVNDLTYLGALGFKPFSAARNLFQPLVTVPADLGGLKDYASLAKGYVKAFDPNVRKYLSEIGIISEYAPEISIRPKALPFSRTINIAGRPFDTAKVQSFKDAAMWMFKASDRFNRYVTGAAAMDKWEKVIAKFPEINKDNVSSVLKQTGANQRNPWIKNEIEDFLRRGKFGEAKASFIRDVVGDTQFLYGAVDAPQIIGRGGSVGRTGLVFQSYFMNLAPLFEKWMTTGNAPEKLQKITTAAIAQAAAYHLMEPIWGGDASAKAIGFGPFPTAINEYMIPPAWTPIYRATRTIHGALTLNPEMSGEQAKKLLGSTLIFVPGGLQAAKTFKGVREEGFQGFAKSIVGYPLESQKKQ